jgi:hypothetical protein
MNTKPVTMWAAILKDDIGERVDPLTVATDEKASIKLYHRFTYRGKYWIKAGHVRFARVVVSEHL